METELEIALFEGLTRSKPVGIHKHLRMFMLQQHVSDVVGHPVSVKSLWDHLKTLYNLDMLDSYDEEDSSDNEDGDEDEQIEFMLPASVIESSKGLAGLRRTESRSSVPSSPAGHGSSSAADEDSGKKPKRGRAPATPAKEAKTSTTPSSPAPTPLPETPASGRRGIKRSAESPTASVAHSPASTSKRGKR